MQFFAIINLLSIGVMLLYRVNKIDSLEKHELIEVVFLLLTFIYITITLCTY